MMSRMWRALRWLLLPFWALQLFSGEKAFGANPLLGSPALNRRGLFVWRARLAHRMTARRRRALAPRVSDEDRLALARDGFILKPDFLPPELFARVLDEVRAYRGPAAEVKEGDAVTRRIALTPRVLKRLPALKALLKRPQWRALMRYVSSFDADPQVSIQTIFTKVDRGREDPQTAFHVDTFHPTLKAWLFLEDVAEEDGPFSYAPGSHRRTPRREAWERRRSIEASDPTTRKKGGAFRLTRTDLKRLRLPEPRPFAVRANTLVVADTYGVHARGACSGPVARLEIWASSRRNPFLPFTGSLFGGRLASRAVPLTWALVDLRRRLGLPVPAFRRVADVTPLEPPKPWAVEAAPPAAARELKPGLSRS
jgi:hypothetical protein